MIWEKKEKKKKKNINNLFLWKNKYIGSDTYNEKELFYEKFD